MNGPSIDETRRDQSVMTEEGLETFTCFHPRHLRIIKVQFTSVSYHSRAAVESQP